MLTPVGDAALLPGQAGWRAGSAGLLPQAGLDELLCSLPSAGPLQNGLRRDWSGRHCIPLHSPASSNQLSSLITRLSPFKLPHWDLAKNCRCTCWFQRPPSLENWSEPRGPFHLPGAELINHHFGNLA